MTVLVSLFVLFDVGKIFNIKIISKKESFTIPSQYPESALLQLKVTYTFGQSNLSKFDYFDLLSQLYT